ncbi:MAG: DUF2752 domain-containing protein [bacterium]|nr:DUF2752 domain-containing protein [bacterium]
MKAVTTLDGGQRKRRFGIGVLLFSIFPLVWVYRYFYSENPVSGCFFKLVTGRPCPFCGLTRAFSYSIHGEFREAMEFHPLWWLAALIILCFIVILFYEGFTGKDVLAGRLRMGRNFIWIFIVFAVITLIVRTFF